MEPENQLKVVRCGCLNENGSMGIYLNGWPLIGGIVREGLGGMTFLEEVCH